MKKLIEALRDTLGVSAEVLPDSSDPETITEIIRKSGKELVVKMEDFKNLQKKLSEKDLELKKSKNNENEKETEVSQMIKKQMEVIENLTKRIEEIDKSKKREFFRQKYPDIATNMLMNVPEEEAEKIVEEQRKINKELMQKNGWTEEPKFESIDQIEKQIKKIKEDKAIDTETKIEKIRSLKKAKNNFSDFSEKI